MSEIILIGPPLLKIPPISGGAIEKYIFELGLGLSKKNYKIIIFTIRHKKNERKIVKINKNLIIYRLIVPKRKYIRGIIYNLKVFREILKLKSSKIIFINGISQIFINLALKFVFKKFFCIFVLHNIRPWYKINGKLKYSNFLDFLIGILCLKISDTILTLTTRMKKYLKIRFGVDKPIKVLPIGIRNELFENNKKYLTQNVDKNRTNKFLITFIGRIIELKGVEYLIKAFSEIKEKYSQKFQLRLIIIGPENNYFNNFHKKSKKFDYFNKIENLVLKYNLQDYVSFKGKLHIEEVYKILLKTDLYVLPSMGEVFSLSTLEALAFGVPVVITKNTGISEYLKNNLNCLKIPTKNTNLLVKAIEKFLIDKDFYRKIQKNSLKIIEQKFLWSDIVEKYDKMIQNLLRKTF
ncbi:MAG: glycosyltransferase family 4 protein [Candidatus Helarchaeota archaeon]